MAEFGGKGNVQTVIWGITEVLGQEYGVDAAKRNPWYFPSIGEYSALLEKCGLNVTYAHHFLRPTVLPDGEKGLYHWLAGFADDFFPEFSEGEKMVLYGKIKDKIEPYLWKDGVWEADYSRIQIIAVKAS